MTVYSLPLPSAEPTTPPAAGSSRHGSPFGSPLECRPKFTVKRKADSRPLILSKRHQASSASRQQVEHSHVLPGAFRNTFAAGSGDSPSSPSTTSLEGLVRQRRERLYVRPLQWTMQHLHVLQCQFVDHTRTHDEVSGRPEANGPRNTPHSHQLKILPTAKTALNQLQTKFHDPTARAGAVEIFLIAYKLISPRPPSSSIFESLQLRYGKHLENLKVGRVYSQPSMVMAYIDLDDVDSLRRATVYTKWYRKLFKQWPDNKPVRAILKKRLRRMQPRERQYDPFLLPVLVALGQERRRRNFVSGIPDPFSEAHEPPPGPKPSQGTRRASTNVTILATTSHDPEHIWAYTVEFTDAFLDCFDDPSKPCEVDQLSISHSRIPLSPIEVTTTMLLETLATKH
ncbi:hypothetical protein FOMA001_g18259 [Fusarium oxysporum f. sp. matthiolae]|nr:hypothetical protein FOMA001_g18259 [Fusarium oxysporum f. sp. matthiolae]